MAHNQQALFLETKQGSFTILPNDIPKPKPGELVVRVKAAALNPLDWKIQKFGIYVQNYPTILGIDIAGEVSDVAAGSNFSNGDRVVAQGFFSKEGGAFQQYALVQQSMSAKVPPNLSYDQAAALPLSLAAAYLSLYNDKPHGLGFKDPFDSEGQGKYVNTPFVILGGASSVGQYAIQLAKHSGFSPIITTASLKHTEHLQALGATHIIDRYIPLDSLRSEIGKVTNEPIMYILDAVSSPETQRAAHDALASGGYLQLVQAPSITAAPDKHVNATKSLRHLPENQTALVRLYAHLTEILEKEILKPTLTEVAPGGLAGIPPGLHRLANNQVSGAKLVVHPDETSDASIRSTL